MVFCVITHLFRKETIIILFYFTWFKKCGFVAKNLKEEPLSHTSSQMESGKGMRRFAKVAQFQSGQGYVTLLHLFTLHKLMKRRYHRYLSSWYEKTDLEVCQFFRKCVLQSNRVVPEED